MRWFVLLALLPLGSCLIGIGDVESDDPGGGRGGSGAADAATGGSSSGGKGGTSTTGGSSNGGSGNAGGAAGGGGAAAGGTGGGTAGGGGAAGIVGSGGTGGVGGTLIFADDFSGDLSKWTAKGDGNWFIENSQLHQSMYTATGAILYANEVSVADVHVIVKAALFMATDPSAAYEIYVRYSANQADYYHCNWEPTVHSMLMKSYVTGQGSKILIQKYASTGSGYDPKAPVTFHMTAKGAELRCWLDELPGSEVIHTLATPLGAGTVGLKTWKMDALFDDFAAYQL